MIYFDTSFLAPLIIEEATTEAVSKYFDALKGVTKATSHWTGVECASLIARLHRMRQIDAAMASLSADRFEDLFTRSFTVFLPIAADFDRARRYLAVPDTGLRAGDALHLAIAANREAERILTLDKGFKRAGRLLGLPVESLDNA